MFKPRQLYRSKSGLMLVVVKCHGCDALVRSAKGETHSVIYVEDQKDFALIGNNHKETESV